MDPKFEIITPDAAIKYLATSVGNRPLRKGKINTYVRDMERDSWVKNGEPIIFDENGCLIDGHHRLTACVESKKSFESLVVRGVPAESRRTIDMGVSRRVGDVLGFHGFKNSTVTTSITTTLLNLERGVYRAISPSSQEVMEFLEKYPEVMEAASEIGKPYPAASNILGVILATSKMNGCEKTAKDFINVFATGVPGYAGCPAHYLRERLTKEKFNGRKTPRGDREKLFLAAWEKFRARQPVRYLKTPDKYEITGWPIARN